MLDAVFLRFDDLVAQTDALKVETVASVYLVAANGALKMKLPFTCVTAHSPFLRLVSPLHHPKQMFTYVQPGHIENVTFFP